MGIELTQISTNEYVLEDLIKGDIPEQYFYDNNINIIHQPVFLAPTHGDAGAADAEQDTIGDGYTELSHFTPSVDVLRSPRNIKTTTIVYAIAGLPPSRRSRR